MARVQDLVNLGLSTFLAKHLGFDIELSITAVGNADQATAYPLTAELNAVTVVTAGDNSVIAESATNHALGFFMVFNFDAAQDLNVFPALAENFNQLGSNTQVVIAPGKMRLFFRSTSGAWFASGDI